METLLAQSREVAANTTEHGDPLLRSETARNFLLHFDHAQITLSLIIVKWNRKIEQEAQHGPLALREAIQQIARRILFGSSCYN